MKERSAGPDSVVIETQEVECKTVVRSRPGTGPSPVRRCTGEPRAEPKPPTATRRPVASPTVSPLTIFVSGSMTGFVITALPPTASSAIRQDSRSARNAAAMSHSTARLKMTIAPPLGPRHKLWGPSGAPAWALPSAQRARNSHRRRPSRSEALQLCVQPPMESPHIP